MQRHPIFLLLIILFELFACKSSIDKSDKNKFFFIDIENCKTSVDLKLSDLIDSCWLVPLETTKESMLGGYIHYVSISDNYILIVDLNGIYKFSANGKFIKKIINFGRGPDDLTSNPRLCYSEKKNLLIINDNYRDKNNLYCYDVKNEKFLPRIKKCFPGMWTDFEIYNDSLIVGSLAFYNPDPNPYAIFVQNFGGDLISGIKSTRKFVSYKDQNEALQRMFIYPGDKLIHVKYIFDDTLFAFKDDQLSPYLIARYNSTRIDPPRMLPKPNVGDKQNYFERYENSGFMIIKNATFEGEIPWGGGAKADYKNIYFYLDKSNGKYGEIKSYTDDFIGKIQTNENETMTFPTSLPEDKLYVLYYPGELLQKSSTELIGKRFPESVYSQLNKIRSSLKETDNSILLIAKPRKKILILK